MDFFRDRPFASFSVWAAYIGLAFVFGSVIRPDQAALDEAKIRKGLVRPKIQRKSTIHMTMFDKEDMQRVPIAWPTVFLLLASVSVWVWSWVRYVLTNDAWTSFFMSTIAAYVAFTPMHEAVHDAIFSRSTSLNWLNAVAGGIASTPFGVPCMMFRLIHLEHHKHTNEGDLDPDHWAGEGPVMLLPLRWATVFMAYLGWLQRHIDRDATLTKESAFRLKLRLGIELLARQSVFGFLWYKYNEAIIICYVFPMMVASTVLMYAFDYLPHRPHYISGNQEPFKATHLLSIPVLPLWVTDALFLQQNLHVVHHLVCYLPFYKYRSIVNKYGKSMQEENGVRNLPLILLPSREAYLEEMQ
eukprot:m.63995 g.63995  ORF g.63995 m.63995 type:complete len:356 (-) comp23379_c0_seq1:412-1479(-)